MAESRRQKAEGRIPDEFRKRDGGLSRNEFLLLRKVLSTHTAISLLDFIGDSAFCLLAPRCGHKKSLATTYFPADEIPGSIIGLQGLTTVVGMGTGVAPGVLDHQAEQI